MLYMQGVGERGSQHAQAVTVGGDEWSTAVESHMRRVHNSRVISCPAARRNGIDCL